MIEALSVPRAFVVRDFLTDSSYKTGFLLSLGVTVVSVVVFYFLSRLVDGVAQPLVAQYGGDYFAFAIVGIAFSQYLAVGMSTIGSKIREGQMTGTLELMLVSPSRLTVVLLSSALWAHIYAALSIVAYLVGGALLGMDISRVDIPMALLAFALTLLSFNALGLLAGAIVLLIKQGNPVNWLVTGASLVLGGVLYPVGVLPGPLQALSALLPLTHALELLRRSILLGQGPAQLWPELLALAVLTAIYLPLGVTICRWSVDRGRIDGSLAQF